MSGRAGSSVRRLAEDLEPLVQAAGIEIGGAEAEIHVRAFLAGLDHALELRDRFVPAARDPGASARGSSAPAPTTVSICSACFSTSSERLGFFSCRSTSPSRVRNCALPGTWAIAASSSSRARSFRPSSTIDVREVVARRHERRIERERLAELGDRLAHEIRRATRAVGDAEQHVCFGRLRDRRQDVFELFAPRRRAGPCQKRAPPGCAPAALGSPGLHLPRRLRLQTRPTPERPPSATQQQATRQTGSVRLGIREDDRAIIGVAGGVDTQRQIRSFRLPASNFRTSNFNLPLQPS